MAIFVGPKLTNASGGNFNIFNGYKIHTFTSNGTFTPSENGTVEVLIVGGGGGSDDGDNSGGGGGSVFYKKYQDVTANVGYETIVGSAGSGVTRTINTFTSPGTYTTPSTAQNVAFLLVGGGGGGDNYGNGGGGGGGSVLYKKFHPVSASTGYPYTIGPGGSNSGNGWCGAKGTNSTAFGQTAYGGGGGRGVNDTSGSCADNPQGSGGGGGWSSPGALGAGVLGYGYPGGNGDNGAGGGGAGGAGNPGPDGRIGGDGIDISISGAPVEYGRGGPSYPVTDPNFNANVYGTGGRPDSYGNNTGTQGVLIVRVVESTSGGISSAFGTIAPGGAASARGNPEGSGGGESGGTETLPSPGYGVTTGNGQIYYGFPGASATGSLGGGGGGAGGAGIGATGGIGVTFSMTGSSVNYGHGGPAPGTPDPGYDVSIYGSGGSNTAGAPGVVIIRYSA
jgi:hypothetical protein